MLTVVSGEPLTKLIELTYAADRPLLLMGHRGIGKSEAFTAAATKLGIHLLVLDLSLHEPTDLIGIPFIEAGRTRFAAPSFWPTSGAGIILIEEVNRAPRYMQAPILQVLTTRTIGEITLPSGWWIAAAINERNDGYFVDELDPALLSRFVRARVEPSAAEWLPWAVRNGVHAKIREFVESAPEAFNDADANPRAWVCASDLLRKWEETPDRDLDVLTLALAGTLEDEWAIAFLRFLRGDRKPLRAADIVERYASSRPAVQSWIEQGSLDLVKTSLEALKRHMQPQRVYHAIVRDTAKLANVEEFLSDLPGDLRREAAEWLKDRQFTAVAI